MIKIRLVLCKYLNFGQAGRYSVSQSLRSYIICIVKVEMSVNNCTYAQLFENLNN